LYPAHSFDSLTPLEETMEAFNQLIHDGKVRYIGNSNFCGWQSMKAKSIANQRGFQPFISQQVTYSLLSRDLEMELIPFALDQGVGSIIWSPLAFGFLTGKYRRGQKEPEGTRMRELDSSFFQTDMEKMYKIIDVLETIAKTRSKTIPQVALNWLLQQPTVSNLIIGARNEAQLRDNLGAVGWNLSPEEVQTLNEVSAIRETYPTWHQRRFAHERNPQLKA
ncbi:MAG: aldo/keto reductase, partial [Verrucomicrobia bacterium]|nr:aldo/keto reductase [Verrucomicrobiota bacterium]